MSLSGSRKSSKGTSTARTRGHSTRHLNSVKSGQRTNIAHAATNGLSRPVHILRKKTLETISSDYIRTTRAALSTTCDNGTGFELLATHRSCFFADAQAFELLKTRVVPGMVAATPSGHTIRIWVPGCGTGEETYSIAMLFLDRILVTGRDVGLQIFATDTDADAIATARGGYYPASIHKYVPQKFLSRYFKREGTQFRILPQLRDVIVFATHHVLINVPFSRLDLISCGNLLNFLPAGVENSILLLFHFGLRQDGILFLRAADNLVRDNLYFEPVSRIDWTARRSDDRFGAESPGIPANNSHPFPRLAPAIETGLAANARDAALHLLFEAYVPASVLVDKQYNALHFFGPIHRYLEPRKGESKRDLVGSVNAGLRPAIRTALRQAAHGSKVSVVAAKGRHETGAVAVSVKVVPLEVNGENVFLISFLNAPHGRSYTLFSQQLNEALTDLERAIGYRREAETELDTVRIEQILFDHEYQMTQVELESTQVELRSLRAQYQATVAEYQNTADDFENILSSSGVPTLFLNEAFRLRFISQTAKEVFDLADADIGRAVADVAHSFGDPGVLTALRQVLATFVPRECEIKARTGAWYSCRVTPYRRKDGQVKGVVVNFFDISALKQAEIALNSEKLKAEAASLAKSRFLAAASHDLRQPLQTLRILQELLLPKTLDREAKELITSSLSAVTAMSGLLNTLLDINQLEAGVIHPEVIDFPVNKLLVELKSEFTFHAQGRGLTLHMVPCRLWIRSDPRLLEDMIRNLLSNAVKYTKSGRILFGCRRRADKLYIDVWDTGPGIPEDQLKAIFREFHQLTSAPRDMNRGLGLGLAIVQRLGGLLGHAVTVRSRVGHGSVFSIEVLRAPAQTGLAPGKLAVPSTLPSYRKANILIIEDDADVRRSYELLLQSVGHHTIAAADANEAIEHVSDAGGRPDLVIADYNLPGKWNGVQLGAQLRKQFGYSLPTVILTGDISADTLREISKRQFIQRSKPVRADELRDLVQSLLIQKAAGPISSAP